MRDAANKLGYWTLPTSDSSFNPGDQYSITLDSRKNPGVAAVAATTDKFRVPYGSALYYNFFSECELQTLGNAWIKIKQYDITLSALADITLKNWTAAGSYAQFEGEAILAAATAYVGVEVGYDSSFNGLIHYQVGTVEVVG